ncbi:SusC/RagA family TonB-linked outer membrane protein [Sediminibacterium soli]|uniref:SusC/RagA family TonB-linked outer membrane protein n=1 Tax=Sediminibacterium soli TaxID=2698829 RepID=UPI00137B6BD6|nr:TonB-dependent receptor [Sediminibacterium soli]NCI46580.1 TonB-dependent receptor [Sediminibacterium soli]
MKKKLLLNLLLILCLSPVAWAQNKVVKGVVTDAITKAPLSGASIIVPGAKAGASTDNTGKFFLQVPNGTKNIQVSMVGYQTKTVDATERTLLNIALTGEVKEMDEVVVVGYGAQKKKDLTGAVSSIGAKDVGGRQTVQISEALQGSIAGVSVTRNSAAPGAGATILIRGITTIGTNSPLFIVDGAPVSNIDLVNPNDVENLTVLKDAASAAIYGSRGAAGVILITTKRGKIGQSSLEYNYEYGVQQATAMPEYVGIQDYYRYFNELKTNDGGSQFYPDAFINSYLDSNRVNPDKFPNVDWRKVLLKPNAPRNRYDLVFTSGNDKIRTKASFGYQKVGAFYDNYDYQRYQFRVNNDLQISSKLSANLDLFYRRSSTNTPSNNPIYESRQFPAFYDDFYDDGRYAYGKDGRNPIAQLREGGFGHGISNELSGRIGLHFKPITGLTLSAMVAPTFDWNKSKGFGKPISYFAKEDPALVVARNSTPKAVLTEGRSESLNINGQFLAEYTKNIANVHTINVMAGYEEIYASNESVTARRTGFPLLDFPYLNAGTTEIMESYGGASENGLHSFFSRLQYNFKNKYYVQGNLRYDQSSRFAKQNRGAFFPSVSAGWTISNESFMKNINWLSFLKLRGSWGKAGNERIGDYPYQATLDFTTALFLQNGQVVPLPGAGQQTYAVKDISWETTKTTDVGIEASFLNNRLNLSADYYRKTTTNILLPLDIPLYIGYDKPYQNAGTLYVNGWELELGWKDRIGKVNYSAAFNLSDAKSRIGDLKGTQFLGDQVIKEGSEYNEWYGYLTNGLFQTQNDLNGAPVANANTKPGDIRFLDVSGPSGKPDGKITPDDKVLLGGAMPRYLYGGNLRADYGGFDFGIAFQGVGKKLSRLGNDVVRPFLEAFGNVPANLAGNFWSKNNTAEQNLSAIYPRLTDKMASTNYALSDFWLLSGAYFRLKNITLGYTLKQGSLKKAGIESLRFYISVNDLFSISKFPRYVDPESGDAGYPIVRTIMAGASIKF